MSHGLKIEATWRYAICGFEQWFEGCNNDQPNCNVD